MKEQQATAVSRLLPFRHPATAPAEDRWHLLIWGPNGAGGDNCAAAQPGVSCTYPWRGGHVGGARGVWGGGVLVHGQYILKDVRM